MTELETVLSALSKNGEGVNWELLESSVLGEHLRKMGETYQNPVYHGEGDVYTHTKMVVNALLSDTEYKALPRKEQEIMFLAALLHDVGKPKCTKIVEDKIASPYHAPKGAILARKILWHDLGLCGSYEKQNMRESICSYIKYHSFPPYAMQAENPEYRALKIASQGELAKSFTMRGLCMLERADINGRIAGNNSESLEKVEFCKMLCQELGCLDAPYNFSSDYTKRGYFKEKTSWHNDCLYNDTWGEVIIMSGLPGTGKDTYIKNNFPALPIVSLDEIRKQLGISPTDKQGAVMEEAHRLSKEYLRAHQPFIWNATSLTHQLRTMQISTFEEYGASVRIVFLETEWQEQLRRNGSRQAVVPLPVIESMLSRLEIPQRYEAEKVEWRAI